MNLHLELKPARPHLLPGEDCWIEYSIENRGELESALHDPQTGSDHAPVFYLRAADGRQREVHVGSGIPAQVLRVSPGQRIEDAFRLDEKAPLEIGSYRLHAVLDPDGLNLASEPIALEVAPFSAAAWSCVPFGLPHPSSVYFSWIREGRYWEQSIIERGGEDKPLFQRGPAVERAEVPADAVEPCTVSGAIDPDDDSPLRWIFWRTGQTVHSRGAEFDEPIAVTLPEGTGPLAGAPLMDSHHRADLFYTSGSELVIARFCDPAATPGESTGVIARAALPPHAGRPALVLDPPARRTERRHIVLAHPSPGLLTVQHAVLSPDGNLSPFRRYEWKVDRDLAPTPDSLPAVAVLPDGSLRVRAIAADRVHTTKAYLLEVTLDERNAPPAMLEHFLIADILGGRTSIAPPAAAFWLADGTVVVAGPRGLQVAQHRVPPKGPRQLVSLTAGAYLATAGPAGLALVPV